MVGGSSPEARGQRDNRNACMPENLQQSKLETQAAMQENPRWALTFATPTLLSWGVLVGRARKDIAPLSVRLSKW
jgi:hypothetical protein